MCRFEEILEDLRGRGFSFVALYMYDFFEKKSKIETLEKHLLYLMEISVSHSYISWVQRCMRYVFLGSSLISFFFFAI